MKEWWSETYSNINLPQQINLDYIWKSMKLMFLKMAGYTRFDGIHI